MPVRYGFSRSPLTINDVSLPPPLIINNPGGQKLCIIRGSILLREFGRAASKFLLKSTKIFNYNSFLLKSIEIEAKSR